MAMHQASPKPTQKVVAGVSASGAAALITFVMLRLFHVDVPADVALFVASVIIGVVMYYMPPSRRDLTGVEVQ